MTIKEKILQRMDEAFKEDRERFFKIADSIMYQPKYVEYLTELENLKQVWRDIPQQEDYPNFTHPMILPDWFPKVSFASCWEKDAFIAQELERIKQETEQEEEDEKDKN